MLIESRGKLFCTFVYFFQTLSKTRFLKLKKKEIKAKRDILINPRTTQKFDFFFRIMVVTNEGTMFSIQCCRHNCLSVCPPAQQCCGHKICVHKTKQKVLISVRNISCPQQMLPGLCSMETIINNNVSSFATDLTYIQD